MMNIRPLKRAAVTVAWCVLVAASQALCGTAALAASDTPQVTKVEPARVTPGSQLTVKVSGKSFVNGAKVSFANPGITVLGTTFIKASELDVQIQVAADAATGATSLFVVNPDDNEVEAPFEIIEGAAVVTASPAGPNEGSTGGATTTAPPSKPEAKSSTKDASASHVQFDVLSLGDIASVLTSQSKASGTLAYATGKLVYTEAGNRVFAVKPAEVKEIAPNTILGMNTGSFHVILNSGKVYNFMAASLKPADSLSIIDALRRALR